MSAPKGETIAVMRHALEQIRAQFSMAHERFVLFTSFNFAAPFFEANVLPLLVGDVVEELQGASETRYAINEDLRQVKCLVVCDQSTLPEPKGYMRYALLPVGLARGRFHPKIMLMAGTLKGTERKGLWLSVGSGNLTLSGWAVNREIVGTTVATEQHAGELLLLLRWLLDQAERQFNFAGAGEMQEEGGARVILKALIEALEDSHQLSPHKAGLPTLHLALPFADDGRGALLDRLKGAMKWRSAVVVSPYWSGVDRLVARLGVEQCTFVPSLSGAGKYCFSPEAMNVPPAYRRAFLKFRQDGERYTHAKALLLEADGAGVLCSGSANFTQAALGMPDRELAYESFANVEAMLRYDLVGAANPWHGGFESLNADLLVPQELDEIEDSAPPLLPFEAAVLCDWRAQIFHARLTMLDHITIRDVELRVDGKKKHYAELVKGQEETARFDFNGGQPVRSFFVSYTLPDGVRMTYPGLVTQVNAASDELGYSPRPRLKKLLELLRALNPDEPDSRARARAALGVGGDGEEDAGEPSFDFFDLFQGTWKLLQYYARLDAADRARDPYDALAPYGVVTLYRAIIAQPALSADEKIGRYVQLKELCAVVERLSERPDGGKFPFRKEVDLQLAALRAEMVILLKNSTAFHNLFGTVTPGHVEAFLEWFCAEIRKSDMPGAKPVHA